MKDYVKPVFLSFDLRAEERLAGSYNPCTYDKGKTTGNCLNGKVKG